MVVTKEWQTGAVFSSTGELISKGEIVTISGMRAYRRWWQFWKPKSWALPPQRYVAGDWRTASWPSDSDTRPEDGDAKQGSARE